MKTGLDRLGRKITIEKATRMCFEKRTFDSRNEARDFSIRGTKRYDHAIQKPYHCQLCNKFHLATVRKARK